MDTTGWHWTFIGVSAATAAFALIMRHRLMTQYPDDDSKQMRSMLGFLRGAAMLAILIIIIAGANLLRMTLT
ncbi:MAG: hypothetical protein M9890_03245 [Thermomicrobiales bacterium]|nr:hypothetical protein [Thermomicrobiales bacterium]